MDRSVFLAACDSYDPAEVDAAVRRCLDRFGGASALVRPGTRVLVKPNLLMPQRPETATTTHPAVVAAIARAFAEAGAQVVVAESAGGPYNTPVQRILYRVCGMEPIAEIPGVSLNGDLSVRETALPEGRTVTSLPIIAPALDADFVVTAAKMKTHGFAYYTGAVKNLFGVVPGLTKAKLHARFPDRAKFNAMLVDICERIRPGLSIVDGVIGMEGMGPSAGSPKKAGVIVASLSPYAADLACARIMGFDPDRIPVLVEAAERGLVPDSADRLEWSGDPLSRFETYFRPAENKLPGDGMRALPRPLRAWIHRRFSPYPLVTPDCAGCGKCAEICPQQVISMHNGHASIRRDSCIKCYCCHEICPFQAIDLVSPRRGRPAPGGT
ncbi:MAG: DUF362 domain-containing protein [Clostridia bacterium]|nr:DUF362 domain-containing protein [Clostridia bacterium]